MTEETLEAAEQRRWECEYHLLENENSRLKKDLEHMQSQLDSFQFNLQESVEYQALEEKYANMARKNDELSAELEKLRNCSKCSQWRTKAELLATKFFATIKQMREEIQSLRKDCTFRIDTCGD